MIKKIFGMVLVLSLLFSLSACGNTPSPKEVTQAFFDAYKAGDTEAIANYYSGDVTTLSDTSADDVLNATNLSTFQEKLMEFEYDIIREEITDKTATVQVSIKTYNFEAAFHDAFSEYITLVFSSVFSNASEEELTSKFDEIILSKLAGVEFNYKKTVSLTLTKKEDGWKIDAFKQNDPVINALTGGLVDLVSNLSDSLASSIAKSSSNTVTE